MVLDMHPVFAYPRRSRDAPFCWLSVRAAGLVSNRRPIRQTS
jgi:hypothetical protein